MHPALKKKLLARYKEYSEFNLNARINLRDDTDTTVYRSLTNRSVGDVMYRVYSQPRFRLCFFYRL